MNMMNVQASTGMSLDERALLVKLSIGIWSAKKTDREVTNEVINNKKATSDSGYFRKQLLGKEALKKIAKVATAARNTHYTLTLPWDDNGARIITTDSYQNYSKVMRDYRMGMQNAVDEFLNNYDNYVKQAKNSLGDMFNRDDYPDVSVIRGKFTFDVEPTAIPNFKDFRAKVSDKEAEAIAKDIERRTKARLDQAMKDIWERVANVTEKMIEKLSDYKPREGLHDAESIFRDSLVDNVRDLAEIMPSLNITNDPNLTKVHKDIVENLCRFDAQELREDAKARAVTAKKARQIFDKVSTYLA